MGTKLRKALCAALACGMLAGALPMAAVAASSPFYDVAPNAWYATAVNYVYVNNLMSGIEDRAFGPSIEATRGQIVTILYRLAGQPAVSGKAPFTDVAANSYYNSAVNWATGKGIVSGTGNGLFQPGSAITREQMATILYRYAGVQKYSLAKTADLTPFKDQWQISTYAKDALSWAVGTGLLNGTTDGCICPHTLTDRAVLATTLMRFCGQYNAKIPTVTASADSTAVAAAPAPAAPVAAAAPTPTPAATPAAAPTPAATTPAVTVPSSVSVTVGSSLPVSGDLVASVTVDGSTVQTPKFTFQWPVRGTISSDYGGRYIFGSNSFHRGIDIPVPLGTAIRAAAAGTVSFSGEQGSYGNLVVIDHGNGFQSYYGHNSKLLVEKGDVVQKNQVIAAAGSTGRSTGNHCHFEVHYKGQVVDPMNYLPSQNDAPANSVVAVVLPESQPTGQMVFGDGLELQV